MRTGSGTKCVPCPFPSLLPFSFFPSSISSLLASLLSTSSEVCRVHVKQCASVICRTKGPQTDSSQTIAPELPGGSPAEGAYIILSQGKEPPDGTEAVTKAPWHTVNAGRLGPARGSFALWFCPTSDGDQASRLQLS